MPILNRTSPGPEEHHGLPVPAAVSRHVPRSLAEAFQARDRWFYRQPAGTVTVDGDHEARDAAKVRK